MTSAYDPHRVARRLCASALAIGLIASGGARPGSAALPNPRATPPPGCVARLRDVRTGNGPKSFASHYVTDDVFGYGEFVAGGFGGQSLWRRRGALWCRVPTGVAILDRPAMTGFGVPARIARRLRGKMKAAGELAPPKPLPTLAPVATGAHHR